MQSPASPSQPDVATKLVTNVTISATTRGGRATPHGLPASPRSRSDSGANPAPRQHEGNQLARHRLAVQRDARLDRNVTFLQIAPESRSDAARYQDSYGNVSPPRFGSHTRYSGNGSTPSSARGAPSSEHVPLYLRGLASHHRASGPIFAQPPRGNVKVFVFDNENKDHDPVIVMIPPHGTMETLRKKIGHKLNIRPMGGLYTVDYGLVRSTEELIHGQEVVATKHAGAPFDPNALPTKMRFKRATPLPTSDY